MVAQTQNAFRRHSNRDKAIKMALNILGMRE
jgi:hypothetical protein